MNDKIRKYSEEELKMIEEANCIMKEVDNDPDVANVIAPEEIRENLFREIRAYEKAKEMLEKELFSEENQELIRLGKIYKKRRRRNKYFVLAAALVLAMSIGITSLGGVEKIFKTFTTNILGREQVQVDSGEKVKPVGTLNEEQVYEEIEEKFGFHPVKLDYLPEWIGFLEAEISEEIPSIYMLYGVDEEVKISYQIRPNYRESSWGKDVEDELSEEYVMELENTIVQVKKYVIENETMRWSIQFEYKDVSYSMYMFDMEKTEVEKIIENLYFF